jgi:hypothetical protein
LELPRYAGPQWRRRKEARPAEITAAALEVFADHGFAAAKLDDVARRAGVAKGSIYLYFSSKEELFRGGGAVGVRPNMETVRGVAETFDEPLAELAPRLAGAAGVLSSQLLRPRAHLARRGGLARDRRRGARNRTGPGAGGGARWRSSPPRLLAGRPPLHGRALQGCVRRGDRRPTRSRPPGRAARSHPSSRPPGHPAKLKPKGVTTMADRSVLIVGAGPTGLVLALFG